MLAETCSVFIDITYVSAVSRSYCMYVRRHCMYIATCACAMFVLYVASYVAIASYAF